ncbi:hypothetical protein [Zongyangia hominis]|uniref:Uncharacterized protein n=1 Tax=Zongyangia hominis TaxID=2763677 RepID=A0A926EFG2_9FIRM|nr:hypothetical protein [Zongyangia hominis]MBC8571194.1 hypothetical protein [Zongyangia hominis]
MRRYEIVEESVVSPGIGSYTALDVVVEQGDEQYRFCNLNLAKPKLAKLVDLCNRLDLSPIHFDEVLEDFIKLDLEDLKPEIIISKEL